MAPDANPRYWLDPSKTAGAPAHSDPPKETVPPEVRAFGFMPSLELLRPGDLLLVSEVKKKWPSRLIVRVQLKAGFHEWHAKWHHAAVYVGNYLVCEATRKGVKVNSVFKYADRNHLLRFRRDARLSSLDSCKLALAAALKLDYKYSWIAVLHLWFQAMARNGWNGGSDQPKPLSNRAIICSRLYAEAYDLTTTKTLDSQAQAGVSPAHLSKNEVLTDIEMTWLALCESPERAPEGP